MPHSKITSKGQITIPKTVRKRFNLKTGDRVDFIIEDGTLKLVPALNKVSDVFAILEKPEKDPIPLEEINLKLKRKLADKNR